MNTTRQQCRACALAAAFVTVSVCSFQLGMVYRELQVAAAWVPQVGMGTRQALASRSTNSTALTLQATATSPTPTGNGDGNALPTAVAGVPQASPASPAG